MSCADICSERKVVKLDAILMFTNFASIFMKYETEPDQPLSGARDQSDR